MEGRNLLEREHIFKTFYEIEGGNLLMNCIPRENSWNICIIEVRSRLGVKKWRITHDRIPTFPGSRGPINLGGYRYNRRNLSAMKGQFDIVYCYEDSDSFTHKVSTFPHTSLAITLWENMNSGRKDWKGLHFHRWYRISCPSVRRKLPKIAGKILLIVRIHPPRSWQRVFLERNRRLPVDRCILWSKDWSSCMDSGQVFVFQCPRRKAKKIEDKNMTNCKNGSVKIFFTPFSWRSPSSEEHPGPPLALFAAHYKTREVSWQ